MLAAFDRAERRLAVRWLVLIGITLTSWQSIHGAGWVADRRILATAAILLAFVKVRIVLLDFMDVRTAPVGLRIALEAWAVVACGAILAMYWLPGIVRFIGG